MEILLPHVHFSHEYVNYPFVLRYIHNIYKGTLLSHVALSHVETCLFGALLWNHIFDIGISITCLDKELLSFAL